MAGHVLITGGRGYIGTYLSEHLQQSGFSVRHLSHTKGHARWPTFQWNIATSTIDGAAFEDVDTIVHLAGANVGKRWTRKYRKEIVSSRVGGTKLLHRWLADHDHDISTFMAASGTGAYGHRPNEVLTEDSEMGTGFFSELSKQWEQEHSRIAKLGIRTIILRQGLVFGFDAPITEAYLNPMRFGINPIAGSGTQTVPWIHIADLVSAMHHMIRNAELSGTFHLVAPGRVTNKALCNELKSAYRKKTLPTKAPAWLLKVLLGERSQMLLADINASVDKLLASGFHFKFPGFRAAALEMAEKAQKRG